MKILWLSILVSLTACSSMLYYPTRVKYVDPKSLKPEPKEIVFYENAETNEKLVAWHFSSPTKPKAIFLVFHGNAQNVSTHFYTMYWSISQGYDMFIFDYPGYGGSHGDPTPQNTVEAGLKAVDYVQKTWPQMPMIVVGQSLGSAVAMRTLMDAADTKNVCAIVIESGFNSYREAGRNVLGHHWLTWGLQYMAYLVLSDKYAPTGHGEKLKNFPLFVAHREEDPIIPYDLGERVYQAHLGPKKFLSLNGLGHVDAFTAKDKTENQTQLLEFLKTCEKK